MSVELFENRMVEPEEFDDADGVDDDEPSGGREDERSLWDTEWELGIEE